jgi:hypothetical protein
VKDLVYLYYPARKTSLTKKFYSPWSGPFVITRIISELNQEIMTKTTEDTVHVNCLKRCYNSELWKPKTNSKAVRKPRSSSKRRRSENMENEFPIGPFPLVKTDDLENIIEHENPLDHVLDTPEPNQYADTPTSDCNHPVYLPPDTQVETRAPVRTDPPVTRSRARILSQDPTDQ